MDNCKDQSHSGRQSLIAVSQPIIVAPLPGLDRPGVVIHQSQPLNFALGISRNDPSRVVLLTINILKPPSLLCRPLVPFVLVLDVALYVLLVQPLRWLPLLQLFGVQERNLFGPKTVSCDLQTAILVQARATFDVSEDAVRVLTILPVESAVLLLGGQARSDGEDVDMPETVLLVFFDCKL